MSETPPLREGDTVPMRGLIQPTDYDINRQDTLLIQRRETPMKRVIQDALSIAQVHYPVVGHRIGDVVDMAVHAIARIANSGKDRHTARSRWWWKIVDDWKNAGEKNRHNSLAGATGVFVHFARFKEPIPVATPDQLVATLAQTIDGLVEARNDNLAGLENLFNEYKNLGRVEGDFAQRFPDKKNMKRLKYAPWLELAPRHGLKDWGVCLPAQGKGLSLRTETDMQTIAVHVADTRSPGEPQWRTLWLSVPVGEVVDSRKLTEFLASPQVESGVPTANPLFEVVVAPPGQELADTVHLVHTANQASVARVVLGRHAAGTIDKISLSYPHLTANENHARQIVDFLMGHLPATIEVPDSELIQPQILNRRVYRGWKEIKVKNKLGQEVHSFFKELEAVAGFEFTEAELRLIDLAQTSGNQKVPFSEMVAIAQSLISKKKSMYICVAPQSHEPQHELQFALLPPSGLQEQELAFGDLAKKIPDWMRFIQYEDNLLHLLQNWAAPGAGQYKLETFKNHINALTVFVKAEMRRGKRAIGTLMTLDTYVPRIGKFLFQKIIPKASDVFDAGSAQVSSVDHGRKKPVGFITALSSFVNTGIGVCSGIGADEKTRKQLTVRWRVETDNLKAMLQQSDISGDANKYLEHTVLSEVKRRTRELRQNIAVLSLLMVTANAPAQVLATSGGTHLVFKRFFEAWREITAGEKLA